MEYLKLFFQRRGSINEKPEVMALIDFPTFLRTFQIRAKLLFSGGFSSLSNKETRITLTILLFILHILYPIVIRSFFGILGFIISYQLYYKYGALKTGAPAFGMLKFANGFHIHHWIYCSIGLITIFLLGITHPFLIGLGFGGITHGIQYSDWNVVKKN